MFNLRKGKLSVFFVGLLSLILLLAACDSGNSSDKTKQSQSEDQGAKVVKDAMGHEVKIPAEPKRILASYLEDPVVALGIKPVAQWSVPGSIQDYLQNKLNSVPKISYDLPPEQVMSYSPDLIIIGSESQVQNGLYDQYSKIAPTYVLGDKVNSDWRETLLTLGKILNKTDKAKKALQDYDQKAKTAKEKLHQTIGDKSVAILWLTQKQFYVVDENRSSGAVLYKDLGLKVPKMIASLPKKANSTWNPLSLEKLAGLDADYIFLVNSDKGQGGNTLKSSVWENLPAVKSGHVYEMSAKSSWLYSGVIANEQIINDVLENLAK